MIEIESKKSLKAFNTFGFDQLAEHYTEISTEGQLSEAIEHAHLKSWPIFILGGGSNIVLTRDIPGLVIRMTGTQVTRKPAPIAAIDADASISTSTGTGTGTGTGTENNKDGELVTVAAGKNWHELVVETLDMGLQGLENLSLIPGTVGAAPVQNIGAYGVEVKDRIARVRALHIATGEWRNFTKDDCTFSYRHSFFKDKPNQYVITQVGFSLGKHCTLNAHYTSLADHLVSKGLTAITASDISHSVIAIRKSKLPDPAVVGNAGSFFHNPIVSDVFASDLIERFPGIVTFDAGAGKTKISAGWLIDQLGYKGFSREGIGVYQHQALVLIHNGGNSGTDLLELANEIILKVAETFNIHLYIEPVVI